MTLVDTSALFEFLAGGRTAGRVAELLERGEAAVAAVTVYELYAGVTNARHLRERDQLVGLCVPIDMSAPIARTAAGLYDTEGPGTADIERGPVDRRDEPRSEHFAGVPGLALA